ncbi:hypothetical protein BCH_02717 [Brucella sp. 191011898]|nr:hypothetical protein BCH_02717 [Brucella sp. 191011898]
MPAEQGRSVWRVQPFSACRFAGVKHAQRLMNAEHRRKPHQHIHIQRDVPVLAHRLHPVVIGGTRGKAKDQKALLLIKLP